MAHFRVDPERVRLGVRWRRLLALFVRKGARVAILTGRRARQARRIVGVRGVEVVGLHGAERIRGKGLVRASIPARSRRALDLLWEVVRRVATDLPGSRVEDKRPGGVALHTRGVRPAAARKADRVFSRRIRAHRRDGIRLLQGKRMIEARAAGTDKGTAARALLREAPRRHGPPVVFFAGDDVTDEDAFRALGPVPGAITVLVAHRPRPTAARFRVADSGGLYRMLARLAGYLITVRSRRSAG